MVNRLANWFRSPEGEAFKWILPVECASLLAEVVQKVIEGLQRRPGEFPLTATTLAEITSIQWQLIFIGFGALIGSFVATPPSRRKTNVLLGPYVAVIIAIPLIYIIYGLGPWIVSIWVRVLLTDTIGLIVIYLCVRGAARVRTR